MSVRPPPYLPPSLPAARSHLPASLVLYPTQDDAGGERFLDVHAILHTSGIGGDEDDEELDALVV